MPFVSEAQRRLMYAAAAGKKTKADISQKAAKKLVAEDEPGKLPEKVDKSNGAMMPATASSSMVSPSTTRAMANPSPGFQGSSVSTAMMKAEGDGSDMAKQLLAQINEMSEKLNQLIDSDQELEDWVDSKIVSAKKDLEDIAGYLSHNEDAQKSIQGGTSTPEKTVARVDGMAKTDEMGDYEKKAQGALDFKNQMKQFRREHGSTIMDIAGGRKIDKPRADAYHAARGNLSIGHGVSHADIPPRIPGHLIHNPVSVETVQPPALPAAKSMEALVNPKSLLQKMDDCMKCMRKSSEEGLEKSSKKKSKPFHGYNKKKHARSGGLNDSYRKKLNRETGSHLKRPVTKKNVKPGSKAAKRRKSFCARMSGVKGPTSKEGKLTPKGAALKRWRCSKSLNKSESVPLELRAQRVLKSLLDKSNTVKPFGENIYDETKNLGRKMKRTGEVVEGAGKNVAVQQTKPTAKKQAAMIAGQDEKKNKKQPVAMFSLENVPEEHRTAVYDAYMNKKPHPMMYLAIKIKPNSRKKAVTPKELLPPKQKKAGKKKGEAQPVILKEEDLKESYGAKSSFAKNDKLAGGKGDHKSVSDFDPLEVMDGKKVEMEHTKDPAIAQEITKDHLSENPKYYSKLKSAGLADELKKAAEVLSKLEKRCWEGYKPVAGKKPYSKGSCEPIGKSEDKTDISAPAMESGKYQGEKLDAHHHNRLGNEYKELARKAYVSGDKAGAATLTGKSKYHFSMADKKGYTPPND